MKSAAGSAFRLRRLPILLLLRLLIRLLVSRLAIRLITLLPAMTFLLLAVIARLDFVLYGKIFNYHFKRPGKCLHGCGLSVSRLLIVEL